VRPPSANDREHGGEVDQRHRVLTLALEGAAQRGGDRAAFLALGRGLERDVENAAVDGGLAGEGLLEQDLRIRVGVGTVVATATADQRCARQAQAREQGGEDVVRAQLQDRFSFGSGAAA
jgi:hypothetical protein